MILKFSVSNCTATLLHDITEHVEMSSSNIPDVPYEIAFNIIQNLPMEDAMNPTMMRKWFPSLDIELLTRDRQNPMHIFQGLTREPMKLIEVMLMSGTMLIGAQAVRYFQPSYKHDSDIWHFVLCDNFLYAAMFFVWLDENGFAPVEKDGKVRTVSVLDETIIGHIEFKGLRQEVHVTKSREMYGLAHVLGLDSTCEHCCITGFGAYSLQSTLIRNMEFSIPFEAHEHTQRARMNRLKSSISDSGVKYVPWDKITSNVSPTQHLDKRLRHVGDKNCVVVPFYDMGVYNPKYAGSAEDLAEEVSHITWWEQGSGRPFRDSGKYISVINRERPKCEWNRKHGGRYNYMYRSGEMFSELLRFTHKHGGITASPYNRGDLRGVRSSLLILTAMLESDTVFNMKLSPNGAVMSDIPGYSVVLYDSVELRHDNDFIQMLFYGMERSYLCVELTYILSTTPGLEDKAVNHIRVEML